jgi:hypothetical protein
MSPRLTSSALAGGVAAIRRTAHRRHSVFRSFTRLAVAVLMLMAAACSSPGASTPAGPVPPDTPAGAQLRWLIGATADLPLSDAQVRAHVDDGYLAMVSPAALNQWLQALNQALRARAASGWTRSRLVSRAWLSPSSPPAVQAHGLGLGSPSTAAA